MSSTRAILSLKWTAVGARGGVRQAVGAFLRYIHYRDKHVEPDEPGDVGRLLRYVAHRDRSSSKGRLFDRDRVAGDRERRALNAYVVRSTERLNPRAATYAKQRAVYRMVLSPEDAKGLDLRQLARATMAGLEEASGGLPPWIAAEHRNTRHPHVHIVLAARRETGTGFRALLINRRRLGLMKEAMALEIARQRGVERGPSERQRRPAHRRQRPAGLGVSRSIGWFHPGPGRAHRGFLGRLQSAMRRYQWRMERELEEQLREEGRER